jgi:hypothetical protein
VVWAQHPCCTYELFRWTTLLNDLRQAEESLEGRRFNRHTVEFADPANQGGVHPESTVLTKLDLAVVDVLLHSGQLTCRSMPDPVNNRPTVSGNGCRLVVSFRDRRTPALFPPCLLSR